jgi:mycofactocin biosynthetic radical S-adenosylmethionine protein MftC
MAFADTLQRTWRENILFSALIELTYRCNLDCFFCYNDTGLDGVPLGTAQYFRLFEDLRELGTLNLTLSGGEPLAHPEFFALGRRARDLGFVVRVKSNGHALRGALARRMREEVDPFIVEVSLHGATPGTHDRQTRMPGSFAKLMANLREARALGLRLKMNCALTRWNEHEIHAIYALADELALPLQVDPQITRRDNGDPEPLQIAPSAEGISRLFLLQRQRMAASTGQRQPEAADSAPGRLDSAAGAPEKHCGAGSSTVVVDPFGNVYPCVQWRRRLGNLHEESIRTLWNDSSELTEVRRLSTEARQAVDRHAPLGLPFCPGTAEQESGHATQLYPFAKLLLDLRKGIPLA